MLIARCAAALSLLVVLGGGCSQGHACPGFETANQSAILQLSCGPTDLVSVALSGPCSIGDASISNLAASPSLAISSPSPGVCHVTLTFATGFTYSADVTFIAQNDGDTPGCEGQYWELEHEPDEYCLLHDGDRPHVSCA